MMVGQTDIDDVDLFWTARVGSCDHSVERAAKLMRRARVVEQQPIRLNELTKLDGVRVVLTYNKCVKCGLKIPYRLEKMSEKP